ncbi:MAG: hypothetical protein SCALA702_00810 [Melioribacteraceae bacterium]|nr:MAG: hypothetical protein SCALA702_00810 [Melioribacteraceae bacterium]
MKENNNVNQHDKPEGLGQVDAVVIRRKLLELFAGNKSVSKEAKKMGWLTFTSDIDPRFQTDYTVDILRFEVEKVPFIPDVIWASPLCTTYSIAAISHHRENLIAKSHLAKLSDKYVKRTQEIIKHFLFQNSDLIFHIENPRATLRKMPFMRVGELFHENLINIPFRDTVTYCQYGDSVMKPTDIWHNNPRWKPRPICRVGDPCHEPAPRSSKGGTQGRNKEQKSIVPKELAVEILKAV